MKREDFGNIPPSLLFYNKNNHQQSEIFLWWKKKEAYYVLSQIKIPTVASTVMTKVQYEMLMRDVEKRYLVTYHGL
jgi:hypothetical protein